MTNEENLKVSEHLFAVMMTPTANKIVYRPFFRAESIYPDEYWLWHTKEITSYPFNDIFKKYYPKDNRSLTIAMLDGKIPLLVIRDNERVIPLPDEMWENKEFVDGLKNCKASPIKYIDTFDGKDTKVPNVPINEKVIAGFE